MNAITTPTTGPWIQTQSGRAFPLLAPSADDVHWRDVSISLGRLCRFNGHANAFYSVAQHSLLVSQLIEEAIMHDRAMGGLLAAIGGGASSPAVVDAHGAILMARRDDETARQLMLAALLHDAHEAYIGDIATPVAWALERLAGADHIKALKTAHDVAIHAAAGIAAPLPARWRALIRAADAIMLATEKRDLLAEGPDWLQWDLPQPAPFRIRPEAESIATDRFADRLDAMLSRTGQHPRLSMPLLGER